MKSIAPIMAALALTLLAGCSDEPGSDSEDLTQSVSFKSLELSVDTADAGLTVIKNRADYVALFGEGAPRVDFNKYWVVHYSMGKQSRGGFTTHISSIVKTGPSGHRTLAVNTVDESPGADCVTTDAITYPQVTVRIKKQPGTPDETAVALETTRDCSDEEGDTCAPNGGTCTDEHVGCYDGEVENEDLTCDQGNSESIQLCCVPEN